MLQPLAAGVVSGPGVLSRPPCFFLCGARAARSGLGVFTIREPWLWGPDVQGLRHELSRVEHLLRARPWAGAFPRHHSSATPALCLA